MAIQQRFAAVALASEERSVGFRWPLVRPDLETLLALVQGKAARSRPGERRERDGERQPPVASQWPVRCSRSHFMPGPGLMPASNLIIKQRPQTASWARATPSFPCAMTCTGGPLNARWAADWRPFPPLPSWRCTATRPELWLASTLLRFPVCGDSLLCDVRPVWRPGHATSGAEAAMPRGPLPG